MLTNAATNGNFLGMVRNTHRFLKSHNSNVLNLRHNTKYCLEKKVLIFSCRVYFIVVI
jgi:hypothetical protein